MLSYAAPLLVLLAASPALADHVSDRDVAVVAAQFAGAKIVPDVLPAFKPQGLVSLDFGSGPITVGQAIPKSGTANKPTAKISGTEAADAAPNSPFTSANAKYTVLLMDGNYPGSQNPNGYNLHYLENNITPGEKADDTVTLKDSTDGPVIKYAGPGPAAGSGLHRYIWLVYAQPDNFTTPAKPAKGGGVALFNLGEYRTASGLGAAIAGSYFTVEEGTATVSVLATSSVDPATVSVPAASGSGSSASGSAAPSKSAAPNGASKFGVVIAGAGIAAFVAALFNF
jgi:phosphatidylethanolamine-binding protein (PEBP) family uncharacterized protein